MKKESEEKASPIGEYSEQDVKNLASGAMEESFFPSPPSLLARILSFFLKSNDSEMDEESMILRRRAALAAHYRFTVSVRRHVNSLEDAMEALNGLKRGELQIIDLSKMDKVEGRAMNWFLCGANYMNEGTWQEVGDNVYLLVPPNAYVEVVYPRKNRSPAGTPDSEPPDEDNGEERQ